MNQARSGAGEIQPSTGAYDLNGREHIRVTPKFTHKPDAHPTPERVRVYSPLEHARRCGTCGAANRWRRIFTLGGWTCCAPAWAGEAHGDLRHECTRLCRLGGVA